MSTTDGIVVDGEGVIVHRVGETCAIELLLTIRAQLLAYLIVLKEANNRLCQRPLVTWRREAIGPLCGCRGR